MTDLKSLSAPISIVLQTLMLSGSITGDQATRFAEWLVENESSVNEFLNFLSELDE